MFLFWNEVKLREQDIGPTGCVSVRHWSQSKGHLLCIRYRTAMVTCEMAVFKGGKEKDLETLLH
jgi:hypothetical protein